MPCRKSHGFTLLELLIVLVLIALISGIAGPNLHKLLGTVERVTRHDGLVADIGGLSYRAFALGQGFELSNESQHNLLNDGNPILAVPDDWQVKVKQPISYTFNGFCSGGTITLIAPDNTVEQLLLDAPVCRVRSDAS